MAKKAVKAKTNEILTTQGDKPPIIYTMENEHYHAAAGVSRSELWDMWKKTPFRAHFGVREETAQQRLGSAAHCAILEPEEFDKRYALGPGEGKLNKNTNEWKGAKAEFEKAGIVMLDAKEFSGALAIRDVAARKSTVQKILKGAKFEQAGFAIDPDYGVLVKCKPDIVSPLGILADVKTAADAGLEPFGRSIETYGYHFQEFFYSRIWRAIAKCEGYAYIVVENNEPFDVALWECPPSAIREAEAIFHNVMPVYKDCLLKNEWTGYPDKIMPCDIPRWGYKLTKPDDGE